MSDPGTMLFAPQARLIDAASGEVIGVSAANQIPSAAAQGTLPNPGDTDLVSAKVTLLNHGVAQLQVVLNNVRNVQGMPAFPPWKYNAIAPGSPGLYFGKRVRLDVRYGGEPWTKLVLARITDMQFAFPSGGMTTVTVVGEDLMSLLKVKPSDDHTYPRNTMERQIVTDVLERSHIGIPLAAPLVTWPTLTEGLRSLTHQKRQTFYMFLEDIAKRLDFEMFVDFAERTTPAGAEPIIPGAPPPASPVPTQPEVKLHFEPARSVQPPGSPIVELAHGVSLIDFTPRFKVWDMPTAASVTGADPEHPRQRIDERLTATEATEAVRAELHRSPTYSAEMIDAIAARAMYYQNEGASEENIESGSSSNLDRTRARLKAIAQLRTKTREFMTAEANAIGFPALRPGIHVHIRNLRPPFDGFYYITRAVHSIDGNGYRTQVTLRRPGMLPPALYMSEPNDEGSNGMNEVFERLTQFAEHWHRTAPMMGLAFAEVSRATDDGFELSYLSSSIASTSAPARIASLMAGGGRGAYFMPEVGDEVVVGFEMGDVNRPVILGALWSDRDRPPSQADTSSSNNVRTIVSRAGHQVTFDDSGQGKITIQTASGTRLELANSGAITIVASSGVTIEGDVTVTGSITASGTVLAPNVVIGTTAFAAHTHPTTSPNTGTPNP